MGTFLVEVRIPADQVTQDQRDSLFDAVADAVAKWEPSHRAGWDAVVTSTMEEGSDG